MEASREDDAELEISEVMSGKASGHFFYRYPFRLHGLQCADKDLKCNLAAYVHNRYIDRYGQNISNSFKTLMHDSSRYSVVAQQVRRALDGDHVVGKGARRRSHGGSPSGDQEHMHKLSR